ncbi:MAG: DUF2085 domain-containing protein [Anaerolineales bacterium]|nr:DUF2085 domain-containing protein [Anaerolineales bacterium]MCB0016337.1 DUF2085 domain-containing protein [Anaerolineales bacterium]MCB0030276.1 DUF2085 domain-containing protein [Anaerolineales bacterium]MCB8959279.1 DUF2085 domain-containing protein [Ardenticatenales bacterium]
MQAVLDRLPTESRRRWLGLVVVLGVLLVLGFYTASDPEQLHDHLPLTIGDYAGALVCHRITERSFTIAGRQMPLCARCTGMYLGIALVFITMFLAGRTRWSELPSVKILLVLLGFIGLMGIDGVNSFSHFFPNLPHLYTPQNWLRLVTGMGTGLALGIIIFPALAQTLWHEQIIAPSIRNGQELLGMVGLAGLVVLLVLSNQPTILYVLGVVSAAGIIMILTSLNSMLLLIFTRRDARAVNWRHTIVPLTLGLALTAAQIYLVVYLRLTYIGTLAGFPGL